MIIHAVYEYFIIIYTKYNIKVLIGKHIFRCLIDRIHPIPSPRCSLLWYSFFPHYCAYILLTFIMFTTRLYPSNVLSLSRFHCVSLFIFCHFGMNNLLTSSNGTSSNSMSVVTLDNNTIFLTIEMKANLLKSNV